MVLMSKTGKLAAMSQKKDGGFESDREAGGYE
jgi:hypothetical protein